MGIYFLLNQDFDLNFIYYLSISTFISFLFLLYRFYSSYDFYELLLNDKKTLDDFIIYDAKSREIKNYNKLAKQMKEISYFDLQKYEKDKKDKQLMIYQWIHQVKTPLSVISLIVQNSLIKEKEINSTEAYGTKSKDIHENNQPYSDEFNKIQRSINDIQYDLDQILNMYKLESIENNLHAEKISLYDLCKSTINDLKNSFIENALFPKINIDKSYYVYSDQKWLKFVISQIIINAIKYSEKNSSINIYAEIKDDSLVLNIKDYGCGIEDYDLPRIFDLFFTGKNGRLRGESSGLGLFMVKTILDSLDHKIEVESKVGQESIFSIIFLEQFSINK